MVVFPVSKKDPDAHLLFPVVKKVPIKIGEIVGVRLAEGKQIIGIIDELSSDKEHFWLRISEDPSSRRERFSFKIDSVIKLN